MSHIENITTSRLDIFAALTGCGYFLIDQSQGFHPGAGLKYSEAELHQLDLVEVLQCYSDCRESRSGWPGFKTLITRHQFIYSLYLLQSDPKHNYLIVSEPLIISRLDPAVVSEITDQAKLSVEEKISVIQLLNRIKTVNWKYVNQLGGILDVLCQASTYKSPALMPMGESSLQILDSEQIFDQISHVLVNPVNMSDLDLSLFQQLKKVIQTGDIAAMNALAKNNSFGSLSFIDQADSELLRSVKDFFIMFCSIDMYLSVEAGMCIPEMLALGIRMINEVEKIKRVPEVISQMEMALSTFTHAVHQFNQQRQSKTMLEVQAYIHEHYAEKITLEDLSRHIGLTPGYLSSRIHKETGLSLADHINRVRVKISKDALVDSRQSINEVAQSVGFLYQNHYARVFRQYTGLSPTEFRERKTGQLNKKIPRG